MYLFSMLSLVRLYLSLGKFTKLTQVKDVCNLLMINLYIILENKRCNDLLSKGEKYVK